MAGVTASRNDYAGIRVVDENWKGRGDQSVGTTVRNVTARENGVTGVRLVGAETMIHHEGCPRGE